MKFAVTSMKPDVFAEVMKVTRLGLTHLGHDCIESGSSDDRTSILFGTWFVQSVPPRSGSIIYNMEQLTPARVKEMGGRDLFMGYTIWDYASSNLPVWLDLGIHAIHVPIGHLPEMETIAPQEKDIDVLLYGWLSPRRQFVVDQLLNEGMRVIAFANRFGSDRDAWIGRSKVVLSVHSYDNLRILELVRIAHCLGNGICVVSEDGVDSEGFEEAVAFSTYDDLVSTCVRYVRNDIACSELAKRGQETMRGMSMVPILERALAATAAPVEELPRDPRPLVRSAILNSQNHIDLITSVIEAFGYQSYLEIGCQGDLTFARIDVRRKVGVDPVCGGTHRMTSDTYFESYNYGEKFDAIFIDGNHHHEQVLKDATNALGALNPGGTIFLHDCGPPDAQHESPHLCCTAWRAFASLRQSAQLDAIVADWDFGTAILRVGPNPDPVLLPRSLDELSWADFDAHRQDWMKLSTREQICAWLEQALDK